MNKAPLPVCDPTKGLASRSQAPMIGAVIPSRNRYAKTARFLETFVKQTYDNLKIYVVDSNSSDATADYIGQGDDGVILLSAGDDDFWTGATNIGVRRALADGCEYILTKNDDSVIEEDLVERLADVACRYDLKILASRVDHLDELGQIWSLGAYNCWGTHQLFYLRGYLQFEDEAPELLSENEVIETELTPGNGVLIHRSVFEKIGLYDEKWTPHYHADSEIILRAREHGFRCYVSLRTVVYNDVHNSSGNPDVINPPDVFDHIPKKLRPLFSPAEKFYRLFWHKRSDRRIPTIFHMVMRYSPPHLRLKTLFLYFGASIWLFYLNRFFPPRYTKLFKKKLAGRGFSWRGFTLGKCLRLLTYGVVLTRSVLSTCVGRLRTAKEKKKTQALFLAQFK